MTGNYKRRDFLQIAATFTLFSPSLRSMAQDINLSQRIEKELQNGNSEIIIPAGSYALEAPLVLTKRGIKIRGEGNVTIACKTLKSNTLSLINCKNVSLENLTIICNADSKAGVSVVNSEDILLQKITIKNAFDSGILFLKSKNCKVSKCSFYESLPDHRWGQSKAADVNIYGGDNDAIHVTGGIHRANGGYAIIARTNVSGEHSRNHIIDNNDIDGYNSYGIMLYRNGPYFENDVQSITDVLIENNTVKNISGARSTAFDKPLIRDFGAGIYIQGAENCTIAKNIIDVTNTSTNTEMLAPGGIGFANVGAAKVYGNKISRCNFGIYINDSLNKGNQRGEIEIDSNIITSVKNNYIKIVSKDNVTINNTSIDNTDRQFLQTSGGHQKKIMNNIKVGKTLFN